VAAKKIGKQPPYQLMATDIDGTLLGPDGRLSPRTLRAARALHEAHIPLVLATSRRLAGASSVAEALGFPLSLILYDGALVRTWPAGSELFLDPLSAAIGQQAVEILAAHRLRPIVQHHDKRGEYLRIAPRVPYSRRADSYLSLYQSQATEVPIADLCRNHGDPLRIVVFGERLRLRAAARAISQLPCGWQFLPFGNYGTSELTIFSPTASKATALTRLTARLGISMEQVMAVGDGINDVAMVRAVGLGVAMANGGRPTRAAAKVIAPPNSEDGAAWAIERYILGRDNSQLESGDTARFLAS